RLYCRHEPRTTRRGTMLVAKTVIWPCRPPSNAVLLAPAQTNRLTTFCRTGASANTSSVGHQTVRQANAPQPPAWLQSRSRELQPRMLLGSTRSSSVRTTMCLLFWRLQFGSPTSRATLEHIPMMKETVEHGADCGNVS